MHQSDAILIALQAFQVAFLWLHDWLPMGRLNDTVAVRQADSPTRLAIVTLIQSVPFTIGLIATIHSFGLPWPGWLYRWLWISYGILAVGQLRAWWLPYLVRPEPERAERYARMFGNTHSFLPPRNGIIPNTAHVLLHLATAATLLSLFFRK